MTDLPSALLEIQRLRGMVEERDSRDGEACVEAFREGFNRWGPWGPFVDWTIADKKFAEELAKLETLPTTKVQVGR